MLLENKNAVIYGGGSVVALWRDRRLDGGILVSIDT